MSSTSDPQARLVRIETKLDMLLAQDKDKEYRLRILERRDAYVVAICGAISVAAPIILKKIFGL